MIESFVCSTVSLSEGGGSMLSMVLALLRSSSVQSGL